MISTVEKIPYDFVIATIAQRLGRDVSPQARDLREKLQYGVDGFVPDGAIPYFTMVERNLVSIMKQSPDDLCARRRLLSVGETIVEDVARATSPIARAALECSQSIYQVMVGNIQPLQEDEMAIAQHGVAKCFTGDAAEIARLIQKHLPTNAHGYPLHNQPLAIEAIINKSKFKFALRKNGYHTVWAIAKSELGRLAKAADLRLRPQLQIRWLQSDEMAICSVGVKPHFRGASEDVTKKILTVMHLPVDKHGSPLSGAPLDFDVRSAGKQLRFSQRMSGTHLLWAINKSQLGDLAEAVGLRFHEDFPVLPVQRDEMAVTRKGVEAHFWETREEATRKLYSYLPVDKRGCPLPGTPPQIEVTIGKTRFMFNKRKSTAHLMWAIPTRDLEKLAAAAKLVLRTTISELQPGDMAISNPGVRSCFVGVPESLATQIRSAAHLPVDEHGVPLSGSPLQLEANVGDEKLIFFRRKHGPRNIWAISKVDLSRLADATGLSLRPGVVNGDGEASLQEAALLAESP